MLIEPDTLRRNYHYNALDRLVTSDPLTLSSIQHFYLKDRLSAEMEGAVHRSIMQHDDQLLAHQERRNGTVQTRLLATDPHRSVLKGQLTPLLYTPYGHRPAQNSVHSLLGFKGEPPDPVTGWYLLGNGYRPFNPVLMCFISPDSWSLFGEGGLNAYAYCVGDPVNRNDPTGHASFFSSLKKLMFWRSADSLKSRGRMHSTKDPLAGTYTKTEATNPDLLAATHLQADSTSGVQGASQAASSSLQHPPVRLNQFDINAIKMVIESDQKALDRLIINLAHSQSPAEKIIIGEAINVIDKRIWRYLDAIHKIQNSTDSITTIRQT
ncbi:hypothetical protein K9857_18400 [Pseudomonas sp. REP124]|uniref:RHS repeat-associated core domain-containing protein n=1 Tax=Pseudomonas sp. REP124 TaxID=2875731 RepID=UPI001CC9F6D1|nr:RHS repeat-associated core domain-containing protein [Pseudomonas sp. REP124]MBZ9783502.1 hypothetical protein [Pseudomonas sp. REP124]